MSAEAGRILESIAGNVSKEAWNISLDEHLARDEDLQRATLRRDAAYASLLKRSSLQEGKRVIGIMPGHRTEQHHDPVSAWARLWDLTAERHKGIVEQAARKGFIGKGILDYPDLIQVYAPGLAQKKSDSPG